MTLACALSPAQWLGPTPTCHGSFVGAAGGGVPGAETRQGEARLCGGSRPGGTRTGEKEGSAGRVLQAGHGEAAPSADQREPRSAQDAPPGRAQERGKSGRGATEGPRRGAGVGGPAGCSRPHRPRPQSARHSKLEKADILEMTVRHLRSLRRGPAAAALGADPAVLSKYRAGFSECLAEVHRFLAACEDIPADVRSRLVGHLAACLGQLAPPAPATVGPTPEVSVGRQPLPGFDGPFPRLRPETAFAPPLLRGLTGAPPAAPSAGLTGRGAPWRPWLR
ncbi:transcription factor HES-4 isoform X1 [Myotis daubentonii]|uniref:transcription factor HES-4 isoform X1 n=1 Tax=Myotis daubentonii TaxID=98922 RepID=UPI002872E2D4|nr:transcription factor HES-4 isoform X1 [Myotis daubentonii]